MAAPLKSHPLIAVVDEISRLRGRLRDLFEDVEYAPGLSRLQSMVLAAALEAPVPPTVPQIGRSLGHPRQVVQRAANDLVDAGLLEKADNPDHKRASLLVATDKARALKQQSDRAALVLADDVMRDFGKAESEELAATLREFRQFLEARLRVTTPPHAPVSGSSAIIQLESTR